MEKEGILYQQMPNKRAVCNLCARRCNIGEGQKGFCGVRANKDGKIYLIVYGHIAALNIDPIEKKPLFHYKPGASMLSVGTVGCNFNCLYCQNWDISHERELIGTDIMPDELVETGKRYAVDGITYTYNEPTIFMEYAIDVAKEARKAGIFNTFVTNGYMTPEAVDAASGYIDAMTVDFKGDANTQFSRKYISIVSEHPIFDALLEMKRKGIFVEITDLVVPKVGDSLDEARKMVKWIYDNLGPDVPIHFLRFHPDFKMLDFPETPVKTLEAHYKIAKEEGMQYVYLGNVPGHKYENTYCPECGALLIKRFVFDILEYNITPDGRCPKCNTKINIALQPKEAIRQRN
ncbi:MAG: AmmeMemoRadiSam system radical SAM enzyme [Candidatus Micrarchaeaceae archaeon]